MQSLPNLPLIYNYWHTALTQTKVCSLGQYFINEKIIFIRKEDLIKGQLPSNINYDLNHALVVPILATNNNAIFIPLILEVSIDNNGYFNPAKHNSLPIIPRTTLEPATLNPIVLGNSANFDNLYALYPPKWLIENYQPNWAEQLEYALKLFTSNAQNMWQQQLINYGYTFDEDWSLVIPTHLVSPPTISLPSDNIEDTLITKLYEFEYRPLAQQEENITLIYANRGAGKTTYIASIILQDWMMNALNETLPSLYAWLPYENSQLTRYANIFDCYHDHETWLNAGIRKEIFSPQIFSDFSISYCIQDFLSLLSNYLQHDILHLAHASAAVLGKLRQEHLIFEDAKALLKSWDDLNQLLLGKYKEKGGIHARIRALKYSQGVIQQELRYLIVISAIWERLFAAANRLPSWFDSIRILNYLKNRKLYKFYAQYFPDDQVNMLSASAMNAKLFGRVQALKNKEHLFNDLIHQSTNELLQLDAIRLKCKNCFIANYNHHINDYKEALAFLELEVIKALNFLTLKYYEVIVLDNFAWSKNTSPYAKYFIDSDDIAVIDVLCVEHANYIPTIEILPLLSKSQKVIIFGNERYLASSLIPSGIDLELCKFNGLDFKDLQFAGILSHGTLWQFASKSLPVLNKLAKAYYPRPKIEYIKAQAGNQEYLGSKYNAKELEILHEKLLEIYEASPEMINDLVVYTTFCGQMYKISAMLQSTVFSNVPVKLLQKPCLKRYKCSLLSVVDCGDFINLDAAVDNLINNTAQKLIIIGDNQQLLVKLQDINLREVVTQ
jgi:hypothetical protein